MNFDFGDVLTRAWQIVWRHKVLWIFGVLASCGRGGGGTGGGGGNTGIQTQGPDMPPQIMRWLQMIQENFMTFAVVACIVLLLLWALSIFLSTIGKVGLIRGTVQAEGGTERLIFGQLFSESTPYFWRIFGLSLIVALPILVGIAAAVAGLIAFAISASGGSNEGLLGLFAILPLFIGCVCLLIPLLFVVGMIVRQAERAIVLEDMPILPAISRGWDVFRTNLGPIILMALILAVLNLVLGFVIALPIFIVALPAILAFLAGEGQSWSPLVLMGICICLYIPVSLLLNGIAIAFTESAWTLTYMRLTRPQGSAP
ncbi:MAG TPA: hypothetical protein VGK56_03080, partial [Anaerolineales bacterium]